MTKPGPKGKPTYLRLLEGNPGKRPFNPNEVKVPYVQSLPAPDYFNESQKKIWEEVTTALASMKGLSAVDTRMLMSYVISLSEIDRLAKKLQALGDSVMKTTGPDGTPRSAKTVPYFTQLLQVQMMALRLAHHFGMTPSARARIVFLGNGGNREEDDEDPFDV